MHKYTAKLSPTSYGMLVGSMVVAVRESFEMRHTFNYLPKDIKYKMIRDRIAAIRELRAATFGL